MTLLSKSDCGEEMTQTCKCHLLGHVAAEAWGCVEEGEEATHKADLVCTGEPSCDIYSCPWQRGCTVSASSPAGGGSPGGLPRGDLQQEVAEVAGLGRNSGHLQKWRNVLEPLQEEKWKLLS